ncbi:MAG TPA: hypothetical protein VJI46_01820 [Candidatus Nanoarchaeia archaeon]|nr:hypothetical protein [Candidatus Nanoarchaeia archaeon]
MVNASLNGRQKAEREGYRIKARYELEKADAFAFMSLPITMDRHLRDACEYSQSAEMDISARVEEIRREGYDNGMLRALVAAKRFAGEGKPSVEIQFKRALFYAAYLGKDISQEVADAKNLLQ